MSTETAEPKFVDADDGDPLVSGDPLMDDELPPHWQPKQPVKSDGETTSEIEGEGKSE